MKKLFLLPIISILMFGCHTDNNGNVTVVPLAPSNLTGTLEQNSIANLSWTDNSTNESGFKIERMQDGGTYAEIATVNADVNHYSDAGLAPNTTYMYRVYAYNSVGSSLTYTNEVTITTQDNAPSTLNDGLVGYWPFNGNANDESGNGNNGTVNGATLANDRFGSINKAYSFNGINNYINLGSSSVLGSTNQTSITISLWVNPQTSSTGGNIISKYLNLDANNSNYLLLINGTSSLRIAGNGTNYLNVSNSIVSNQWSHLVAIIQPGTNNSKLYVNNELKISGTINLNNSIPNTQTNIGRVEGPLPGYFNGSIDDIRIYNRALTQEEISYLAAH